MSEYEKPIQLYDDIPKFIFNTYPNTDLIDFKDDYIELDNSNEFKILLDYNCDLVSKKRDTTDKLGNYNNINSPNSERNIRKLEIKTDYNFNCLLYNYAGNKIDINNFGKPGFMTNKNVTSDKDEGIKKIKNIQNSLPKFKDYYTNLNDYDELRKLNKTAPTFCHSSVKWDEYKLCIWTWFGRDMNMAYIISHNDKIISVMLCDASYQIGDCGTYVYVVNDKHMLIYNAGDVWSTVTIKNMIN